MQRVVVRNTTMQLPTAAKLIGVLGMSALAFLFVSAVLNWLPAGVRTVGLLPFAISGGVIIGWRVLGMHSGKGWPHVFGLGGRAAFYLGLYVLFFLGTQQMMTKALRMRYDGPIDAIVGVIAEGISIGIALLRLDVMLLLFIGGMVSAMMSEYAARRWP